MADDLTRDQKEAEQAADAQEAAIAAAILAALLSLRSRVTAVIWWFPATWGELADDLAQALQPIERAHDRAAKAVWLGYDPVDGATVSGLDAYVAKTARDVADSTRRAVEKVVAWGQVNGVVGDALTAVLEATAGVNGNQIGPVLAIVDDTLSGALPRDLFDAPAIDAAMLKALKEAADAAAKERAGTVAGDALWTAVQSGRVAAGQQEQRATNAAVTKTWITAEDERVCPKCGPLHDVTVPINEPFTADVFAPPRHVACRCWIIINAPDEQDDAP